MDRRNVLRLGLLAVGGGLAGPALAQSGWTTLLDGTSLGGWTPIGTANWKPVDGAVQADQGNGFLVSDGSYGDFDLKLEFWVDEAANSGVFIRCADPKTVTSANSYEVNIFEKRPDQAYATGGIVDVAKVAKVPKTGGRWNTMEVAARGPRLSVTVNGARTVAQAQDARFSRGPVALQYAAGVVKFRKVMVRSA